MKRLIQLFMSKMNLKGSRKNQEVPAKQEVLQVEPQAISIPEEALEMEQSLVSEEPQFTEPPTPGWEEAVKYLSQSEAITPDVQAIMDKYPEHALKIVESNGQYEAFLIHRSSLPTNQTLLTLRSLLPLEAGTYSYGMHKLVRGSYKEVIATLS